MNDTDILVGLMTAWADHGNTSKPEKDFAVRRVQAELDLMDRQLEPIRERIEQYKHMHDAPSTGTLEDYSPKKKSGCAAS